MFLDEINKNEIEYIEKLKSYVKETFINFYGEKYRKSIENKIDNTPIMCFDRKQLDSNYALNKIDKERNVLLKEWFSNTFDIDENFNVNNLETIKEVIDLNNDSKDLKNMLNDYLNNTISSTKKVNYKNKIKKLINDYNENYKDYFDKLLALEDEMYANENITLEEFKTFEELNDNNKYVQSISDKLNEDQKKSLLKICNTFIKRESSRGIFVSDSNFNKHFEAVCLPDIRFLDLHIFIHELNHAISHKIEITNDTVYSNIGFFKKEENLNKKVETKYSYLNEIITDYFATKMDKKDLENKNLTMHSNFSSSYSRCFVTIEPFMKKFFNETKECFIEGDTNKFEKLIGKYNLENLEHLLQDCSGYIQTMEEKNASLVETFEEGLVAAMEMQDSHVPNYVTKYYNSFLKMHNIMVDIERYQKNNSLEMDLLN